MGCFPSPSPSLHRAPSIPLLKKKISADTEAPPPPPHPPLLSAYVHSLPLYLLLPLSAIISPPLFSPSRRIHPPPLLRSNPTAINQPLFSSRGRLVSAPSSLSLFTVSSIQSLHLPSPPLSLLLWHPLFLALYFCLPLKPQVFNLHCFFFLFYLDIKQIVYALAYELLIKMHYVGKQSSQLVRIDVIVYTAARVEQTHRHFSVRGERCCVFVTPLYVILKVNWSPHSPRRQVIIFQQPITVVFDFFQRPTKTSN